MLQIGFIGTGNIAGLHLQYLQSRGDVQIAALCDTRAENAERRRAEFGGAAYSDFRSMLDAHRLDAVWLCTPPEARREPLLACAERGVPVFCEKPVECSLASARGVAHALEAHGNRVQVGYVIRPMPIVQRLRELMADDSVHVAQSLYLCDISLKPEAMAPWLFDKSVSGGPIVEQGTHNLDLLRYLFGEAQAVRGISANPVRAKDPAYSVEEAVSLGFVFGGGTLCTHTHSWVSGHFINELVLSGEKRLYRLGLTSGTLRWQDGDGEMHTFSQGDGGIFAYEDALFLDQVASGDWSRNICSYADGMATLALCLAADQALSAPAPALGTESLGHF